MCIFLQPVHSLTNAVFVAHAPCSFMISCDIGGKNDHQYDSWSRARRRGRSSRSCKQEETDRAQTLKFDRRRGRKVLKIETIEKGPLSIQGACPVPD
jgi:hypothetical protein